MRSAAKTEELLLHFMSIYIFSDNGHVWDLIQKTPPPRKKMENGEQLERVAAAGCSNCAGKSLKGATREWRRVLLRCRPCIVSIK